MRRILIFISALVLSSTAFAQAEKYEQRYDLLVSKLGYAGVGVETVLNNWEQAAPSDPKMLLGKFNYYFTKAQSAKVVTKPSSRFLGNDPILTLKDSTGRDVHYFQELFYDDDIYGQAMKAVDKAIGLYPEKLDFRFVKANAYIAYEKESPDMAISYLLSLVDETRTRKVWVYNEETADAAFFADAMLEYCFSFYTIGSPSAMNAFHSLSQRMLEVNPDNPAFLNNIGTYNLLVKEDYKTALKCYNKVLKANPDDYTAIKNCVILARKQNNVKLEKKYLQKLLKVGDEKDKALAEARLKSFSK